MLGEDPIEGLAHGRKRRIPKGALREGRRVAGREKKLVSLPEGDLELVGDTQEHLPTRFRAAGFDETQVAR